MASSPSNTGRLAIRPSARSPSATSSSDDEALLELYVACDTLIGATEEVYEISETTGKLAATGERWLELARRAGVDLPENPTQRQALLALVPDAAIVSLYNRYYRWIAAAAGRGRRGRGAGFREDRLTSMVVEAALRGVPVDTAGCSTTRRRTACGSKPASKASATPTNDHE
jgi:hypothetical protein